MTTLDELLTFVANLIASLFQSIQTGAQGALTNVTSWINAAVTGITQGITTLINNIVPVVTSVISHVVDAIQQFFGPFLLAVDNLVHTVTSAISTLIGEIHQAFQQVFQQIVDVTLNVINTVQGFIADAVSFFQSLAETVVNAVHNFIQNTVGEINAIVTAGLQGITSIVNSVTSSIQNGFALTFNVVAAVVADITATVQAAWQQLVIGAESIIATVNERISGLRDAFKDAAGAVVEGLKELDDKTLGKIRDGIDEFIKFTTIPAVDFASTTLVESMRDIASGKWDPTTIEQWIQSDWFQITNMPPSIRAILLALVQAGAIVGILAQASETQAARYKQQLALEKPWEVLSPGDVSAAYRRKLIAFEPAKTTIRKSGFSEDDARTILSLADETPSDDALLALWLRGSIPDERLDQALFQRGYNPEWTAHLKELSQEIPPLEDIIRMGRRLVFDDAVVEQFKLDDDFQAPVEAWARKKGLSSDWVHRYWQAHWDLPSVSQGFEMLQRGVIDRAQLDLLFRDAGMAPGWRDKLLQIAYSPFTRVDIRRMHKAGVLDVEAVRDAYLQIGYDAVRAQQLTDFTVKANAAKPQPDLGELGKVSTSSVLTFLADGVITQPEAIDLLIKAGKTRVAAEAFVFDEVLKIERRHRQEAIDHIIALVKGGVLDEHSATDELHRLNLTTPELDKATLAVQRLTQLTVTLPTQSQGEKMFTAGIITEAEYRALLTLHGYASKWVDAFVALTGGQNAGTA